MKVIIIILLTVFASCTHQPATGVYKIVTKTGNYISINNQSDTIKVGDTLAISFNLSENITLDDNSALRIKKIDNTGYGYLFKKNFGDSLFGFVPLVLEKNLSALKDDGRFFFKPSMKALLGSTIHYVPQDTGTYVLTTERNQYIVCTVQENEDTYQINLIPDFDVPSIHEYLLNLFPLTKEGKLYGKANEATPYYCFYVKPK
jgi:hypothetical protein